MPAKPLMMNVSAASFPTPYGIVWAMRIAGRAWEPVLVIPPHKYWMTALVWHFSFDGEPVQEMDK